MRPLTEWPAADDPETVEWRAWLCRRLFRCIDGEGCNDRPYQPPLLALITDEDQPCPRQAPIERSPETRSTSTNRQEKPKRPRRPPPV